MSFHPRTSGWTRFLHKNAPNPAFPQAFAVELWSFETPDLFFMGQRISLSATGLWLDQFRLRPNLRVIRVLVMGLGRIYLRRRCARPEPVQRPEDEVRAWSFPVLMASPTALSYASWRRARFLP